MKLQTDLSVEEFNKKAMTYHLMAKCLGWGMLSELTAPMFHPRKRIGKKFAKRAIVRFVIRDELKLRQSVGEEDTK